MLERSNAKLVFPESTHRRNWKTIERSLDLSAKAEELRQQARELCETSRLLRAKSARIKLEVESPELCDENL